MRKIIYFLFLVLTFYLAGRYRLEVLNLLVFAELILFSTLFFTTRYFRKSIDAKIEVHSREVKKGNVIKGKILITNQGYLPITRFCVKIEYFNNKVSKTAIREIKGYISGRSTSEVEFQMKSKYCGILNLKVREIKVYDYLILFNQKKKSESDIDILILPSGYQLMAEIENKDYVYFSLEEGKYSEILMNQPPEILWIDKYRQGDSIRDIHWKLSARNDEVLSKKYSSDIENKIIFFIDLRKETDLSIEKKDVFYELCSAISLGLMENKITHLVRWYDIEKSNIQEKLVRTEEDYIDMIEELMLKAKIYNEEANEELLSKMQSYESDFETVVSLKLDFNLTLNNKHLLMKFTEENYVQEIERGCLTV